ARGPCDLDRLVVNGMFLGLVATAGYGALGGWMHDDETFRGAGTLVLAVSAALALLVLKTSAGQDPPPGSGGRAFGLAVVFPVLLIATLSAPKIFWEQATGDGAHSFEAARLLLHGRSPFFPRAAGAIANYPGVSSMLSGLQAVPFLSLMGETIAAPRLTMLLNLGFLAAALRLHLAPVLRNRLSINLLMWGALVATYLALGWSASYDAYSADLALPASQDLLLLAGVVATLDAWRRREWMRFCGFCFVTLTVSPGAALLLIFLPLARVLASGPGTGAALVRLVFALGVAFALHAGLAWLATRYWGQEAGAEYQSRAMLSRLRYLDFGDPRRWLWLIPGGLFPLAVYFRLCRIGVEARTIAGLGALSFVFYGLLIRTNLHYF
ncbi:MAG: hypothetical protein KDB18_13500, partial [Salinibacterium sp.]|nr:hypothetical protein [Salinibacterium sp.]